MKKAVFILTTLDSEKSWAEANIRHHTPQTLYYPLQLLTSTKLIQPKALEFYAKKFTGFLEIEFYAENFTGYLTGHLERERGGE